MSMTPHPITDELLNQHLANYQKLSKRNCLVSISVPGMPAGSPVMEVDGVQHAYQVIGHTEKGTDLIVATYPAP